ncbi:Bifunctional epoxide hydrolase 2-like protein [Drosera capensis]
MGAMVGWYLCLFRPDRVKASASLSVPLFRSRNPKMKPVPTLRAFFGEEYCMCRFQEPGKMEAEIAKYDTKYVLQMILTERSPTPHVIPKENPFGSPLDAPITPGSCKKISTTTLKNTRRQDSLEHLTIIEPLDLN